MKNAINLFLLVISMSWVAQAYLVPGPPGGGGQPAPYPGNPGGGHGGGGLVPGPRPPHPRPQPPPPRPNPPPRPPAPPYYPPPQNPPYYPPQPPPPQNPGYGAEVKSVWIGRDVYNETIRIQALAGIGRQYSGWEVISVRANTRPNSPARTDVALIADGRVVASQINPGYQINLFPQVRTVLSEYSDLQLNVGGGTYINDVLIEIRYNGGGYNPPSNPGYGRNIDLNIYRSVYGNDRIDLTQYFNLASYRGYTIQSVIITASSRYNTGFVSLLINGNNMGQVAFSSNYSQQGSIYLNRPAVIGQGADSLVLYTQGDMTIERVTIVLR